MSASLNKPEDGKCHYPLTIHVSVNHLNACGHGDTNWHQQEHDKICPDTVIRSPAVESSHHLHSSVTALIHLETFSVISPLQLPLLGRLVTTKSIR